MVELVVDVAFRNINFYKDSKKRSDHVMERMRLRGIGVDNIKEAIQKGAKRMRFDRSIVAQYRWFQVAYREIRLGSIRKIYPITVIDEVS